MIKKLLGILFVVFLIAGGAGAWYVKNLLQPVNANDKSFKTIVVGRGESFQSIAQKLTDQGIIKSTLSLKLANYLASEKKTIQAGGFRVSPSMTPEEVLETLSHGKIDLWVKLLEGWRREEMADALEKTFAENNVNFDKQKFINLTKTKEGYLFPDSYLFPLNTSEEAVVSLLENTLEKKITPEMKSAMNKSGKSLHQILTMASIIEREARSKDARRKVSGILWKRIDAGWPLQADATLQYAKGYDTIQKTWWKPPIGADKTVASPYNSYQNTGLPPGPICAPSLSSIEAAVFPETTDYWFYITDTKGNMHYAATLDQHNANVNKYLR